MNKLDENVYQFPLAFGNSYGNLTFSFSGFLIPLLLFWGIQENIFFCTLLFIPGIFLAIEWFRIYRRNFITSGIILDKNQGMVFVYKWTWNIRKPQQFLEIPLEEIKNIATDEQITTTTKVVADSSFFNPGGSKLETREQVSYNLVLHGKFGSRRVTFLNLDDRTLFETLLNDEDE